jgi:hypothetical protein
MLGGFGMSKHFTTILLTLPIVLVLGFVGYSLYRRAMNAPIPRQAKLVDCTGAVVTCSFTPRKAHAFSMLMVEQCQFTGRVQILRAGQQVGDFGIDSDRMKQCNWLQTKGIPEAWILTDHLYTNYPGLQRFLTPGEEHQIVFSFQYAPVTNASIWMTWHERAEDFRHH